MATNIDMRPKIAFAPESKAARLRAELCGPELAFLMEAHDGLPSFQGAPNLFPTPAARMIAL